jgi:hypothetical protein
LVTGAGENFGCESIFGHNGGINFAFRADSALIENFKRYFDWLWANSREITAKGVVVIPDLVLPEGTEEGVRLWRSYLMNFNNNPVIDEKPRIVAEVDPATGDVTLCTEDGQKVTPPTEELGLAKLDPLAEHIARLYAKGALVSIDKLSRIPPLDAPLDPSLFGDASEKQKGSVTRKVSMRVSIIDNATLRELENRRKALRPILNKFTFGLADNMRWMPHSARELFEQEVANVNAKGRDLITNLLKGDVKNFIAQKRDLLIKDINAWHQELGRQGSVPENVIEHVERDLMERLTKAQSANFMPRFTYSSIAFNSTTNDWASPWGQAFSLLYDIAVFPREALTDFYFFRGLEVSQDDLIETMNVANDATVAAAAKPKIKDRCKAELELLKRIEGASVDARKKCELVWKIIGGGEVQEIAAGLENMEKKENG